MTHREAKEKAATRGFTSVKHWMKENRKAWSNFHSRLSVKGEDRDRLARLMQSLDSDYEQFKHLQ